MELSDIPNSICDEDFENTVTNICKESGIDVEARDIEECHRSPLSRNSRGHDKRVIVKFVNRKYAEALLKDKKNESVVKTLDIYLSLTKFLYLYLFAHTIDIYGVNVQLCKDKERFTMFFI